MHKVLRWTDASPEAQHDSSGFLVPYAIPVMLNSNRVALRREASVVGCIFLLAMINHIV